MTLFLVKSFLMIMLSRACIMKKGRLFADGIEIFFLLAADLALDLNLVMVLLSLNEAGADPKKLLKTFKKYPLMKPIGYIGLISG